jgi:hypothetical protein
MNSTNIYIYRHLKYGYCVTRLNMDEEHQKNSVKIVQISIGGIVQYYKEIVNIIFIVHFCDK